MSVNSSTRGVINNKVVSLLKEDTGILESVGHLAGCWRRTFTKSGIHPYDEIEWKFVDAEIKNSKGDIVFSQKGIEVPAWWTQNTINIVADKYFRVINGVRENSVKQIFERVASKITEWADQQNFFNDEEDAAIFKDELIYALLHQYGAFNSPVWFNLGVPERRQAASACFISSVEDTLESIMEYQVSELTIFKSGSGSGANLSSLRSSYEKISSGSYTSGPLSFMRGLDQYAGSMKSGGSTRNAAKMVILDMDHPDILETKDGRPGFIRCKAVEEKTAHDLVNIGYSSHYDDPNGAYKRVMYQNANHSVSVPDSFMQSMLDDGVWNTKERKTGKTVHSYKARDLWHEIAEAAWTCGDPGVQFRDTINKWHTIPNNGEIRSSNPCSEFLCVDDTACNLCAINLTKFFDGDKFNYERYKHAVRIFSTSQMAIVDKADYPTDPIKKNSLKLRPIGTNYGDLGALLMKLGYGYDSDEGRAIAARLASLMTGLVYDTAARLAARTGSFEDYEKNSEPMLRVMRMHQDADRDILKRWNQFSDPLGDDIALKSSSLWRDVISLGEKYGYYVCQATLQAPLGTISFLMGMNTTGIEPAFSLVSYKKMVGGGFIKIVNATVRESLENLGYSEDEVQSICKYIESNDTIEGAPELKNEHVHIFDCAASSKPDGRYLTPMAHIKMMAAIQPLITCAISKTVNLPNSITVQEIADIYQESWRLGIKCVALYRDGCKASQPLAAKSDSKPTEKLIPQQSSTAQTPILPQPVDSSHRRKKMPSDVTGWRHKFVIDGFKGYIVVNEYPDGTPGEVFFKLGKPGSTVSGLIDGFTQLLSISLQYGVPLEKLITSFINTRFEPAGMTNNKEIRFTTSLYDYLFKTLDTKYFSGEHSGLADRITSKKDVNFGISEEIREPEPELESLAHFDVTKHNVKKGDSPLCSRCGSLTQRNGSCYLCVTCGTTTGCS